MKNRYHSWGNHTLIYCKHRGKFEGVWIDTKDLSILCNYNSTLCISENKNTKYSYLHTKISGENKKLYLHRVIFDNPSNFMIDHINHDGLDNRRINLNLVTNSENQQNKLMQKNNTSGVKGVTFNKRANKWEVRIQINKKNIYLGLFTELNKAVEVRKEAEKRHFKYLDCILE